MLFIIMIKFTIVPMWTRLWGVCTDVVLICSDISSVMSYFFMIVSDATLSVSKDT